MESTELDGHPYDLNTNTVAHSGGNKKQRDLEMLGGGTGDSAVIWAPAGSGNDALIGTPFGAVTGAAGVALTGNKDIAIRTELAITVRPLKPVE
jgi:Ca2+-binding RTX toxin-like protein